jgi:hypothetical protein
MSKFRSKTPVSKKIIQPIIHREIQPVITKEIQPVIIKQIQPVVHLEIQPIIHQEIQPVITTEIQPIIQEMIQPVIFDENQTNIEEVILQLYESHKEEKEEIEERHITKCEVVPLVKKEQKHIEKIMVQPYIMKKEEHLTKKDVDEKKEYKTMKYYRYKFVPYIRKKNGDIIPLDPNETDPIQTNTNLMETVIAVIFSSLTYNINFPMACKKTDIFSKIEIKLYQEFPELKNKKLYFISGGRTVNKHWTFEENKIKNGSTILIQEINE